MKSRVLIYAFVMAVVTSAVMVPNTIIHGLFARVPEVGAAVNFIHVRQGPVNVVHVLLFLMLGLVTCLVMRDWGPAMGSMVFLGLASELAQVWIPGRHARWSDVVVDVAAGAAGFGLATLLSNVIEHRAARMCRVGTQSDPTSQ